MGRSKTQEGMGFLDLTCFNNALLTKQGWRIIQNPNSLVGSILKAKYFQRGSLLEVQIGSRPSFTWRSLLAATNLLKEGLFWQIGNGKDVKIWGSKWIPKPSSFSVQSPCSQFKRDEKVAALIEPQRKEWNTQVIQSIFKKDEAELICNIPMSKNSQPDKLVWRATQSGIFTVKSAYYLEKERSLRENGECSGGKGWEVFWKMI